MSLHKQGTKVSWKAHKTEGEVIRAQVNDAGEVAYLVNFADNAGMPQQRWFREEELTAAPTA